MLFHSLGLPRKIRCVLRVKIVLDVNSAFLVRVKGIDTNSLTEEEEKKKNNNNNKKKKNKVNWNKYKRKKKKKKKRCRYSLLDNRWRWKCTLFAY